MAKRKPSTPIDPDVDSKNFEYEKEFASVLLRKMKENAADGVTAEDADAICTPEYSPYWDVKVGLLRALVWRHGWTTKDNKYYPPMEKG